MRNVMHSTKSGFKIKMPLKQRISFKSENERSHDLTPNIVRQNSEKAKQMIAKMFTDENDTYEHSDDEEIEEHLARQRISKREVSADTFDYGVSSVMLDKCLLFHF